MAQNVATEQLTITDWVKALAAIPSHDFTLENVQDYILRHSVRPETLGKYCYFSKGNYTRNLIFKNEVFECMTICWEIGQASRIPGVTPAAVSLVHVYIEIQARRREQAAAL